jgi:major membrane immunogen (membrane-anchored lipoprotein)
MVKKLSILIIAGAILLTGCAASSETIICQGKDNMVTDDTTITLNDGWFVNGYKIDYENNQVILSIENEEK